MKFFAFSAFTLAIASQGVVADVFIANPFSEPHCFKIESAQTAEQGAKELLNAYKGSAKIIQRAKVYSTGSNQIFVDIPGQHGSVPVVVMDGAPNECTKWIDALRKRLAKEHIEKSKK